MINVFEGNTANDVWQKALSEIYHGKNTKHQTGRGGTTLEILHAAFTLTNPRQRWIVARYPALNPAFAIAEVIWILCGRNDAAFLNYWNSQLPKYAGTGTEYHGAYGYRLRTHFEIDQLERAYLALQHNPDSRQVVLQIWDSLKDFPDEEGNPVNPDIPCNITSLLKIRDGRLEWMQIMRSNDLFRGVPYNFIQFTSIQEILAGWLNVEPGSYNQISDSLHIYSEDAKFVKTNLSSDVQQNTDSLCLPKERSDAVLAKLNSCIEAMIAPNLSQEAIHKLLNEIDVPNAYHNLLLVVGAEAARKRGWLNFAQTLMVSCSNPVLTQAWERWFMRFQRQRETEG
ncbi:MAG TPA: thymidylate synthase [Ktedonobacteraceae bacterium]|nr:thymidylate synthase [Ktedonobacteraceae bacterium]